MRETDLLGHIYDRSSGLADSFDAIEVGPGDDCAVVRVGDARLLVGVDQLIEGRHFEHGTDLDLIARKSIARNVSDIAAMGGEPSWSLASAAIPKDYPSADALFDAMSLWAIHWKCPLVGGDISATNGPLSLSVTIAGTPHTVRGPVLRSTARPGDVVATTGPIGGSLGSGRHLTFEPHVSEARTLCTTLGQSLHAMIDVSDGLGLDASRIARASHVGLEINLSHVPLSPGVEDPIAACGEGEDHVLVFTADPRATLPEFATVIGRVVDKSDEPTAIIVTLDGTRRDARDLGWVHE